MKAICEDINQLHQSYGDLPIFLVGSSSMAQVAHRSKLEEAISKSLNLPVDFITAKQEVGYLARGIWASLPPYRQCESAIIDIGGNIKGGYLENCNSKGNNSIENQLVPFEIEKYGPKPFSQKAQQKIDQKKFSTFLDASDDTRKDLESILYDEVSTRPEFTNGKKRVYLVGGAVWAADTLLCLNCPQYERRSQTDDQDEYTVMKPSDIEEFYRYVSKEGDKVCDHSQENPYLRRDLDGGYNQPWDKNRIEKQQAEIDAVCRVFTSPQHLISAAEILRAIKNKMEINENRHIFFMQNNLYTWSKQYLIDKIQ